MKERIAEIVRDRINALYGFDCAKIIRVYELKKGYKIPCQPLAKYAKRPPDVIANEVGWDSIHNSNEVTKYATNKGFLILFP